MIYAKKCKNTLVLALDQKHGMNITAAGVSLLKSTIVWQATSFSVQCATLFILKTNDLEITFSDCISLSCDGGYVCTSLLIKRSPESMQSRK